MAPRSKPPAGKSAKSRSVPQSVSSPEVTDTAAEQARRRALRRLNAHTVSASEQDYLGAIDEARALRPDRLINLLESCRPLTDDDFAALAGFVRWAAGPPLAGRPLDYDVHDAAFLVKQLRGLTIWIDDRERRATQSERIEYACQSIERDTGRLIDRSRVRDLVDRPLSRLGGAKRRSS